jgi:hypothetical protein
MRGAAARLLIAAALMAGLGSAAAADLYGRVYDTLRASMYPGAVVMLQTGEGEELKTVAGGEAEFRFTNVRPGVYRVRIVAAGREVAGRLRVAARSETQVTNLDLGKIDPPDEGDAY